MGFKLLSLFSPFSVWFFCLNHDIKYLSNRKGALSLTNDQARRELIFQAMEELLLEEGRESLTYAKISERCHLHTNTITYYFDGKEDMMVQFFQHVVDRDNANLPAFFTHVPDGMTSGIL